jgi:hypothetical protein
MAPICPPILEAPDLVLEVAAGGAVVEAVPGVEAVLAARVAYPDISILCQFCSASIYLLGQNWQKGARTTGQPYQSQRLSFQRPA